MARHGNAGHCNAGNLPAHAALPCTTRLADERHPLRNGVPYLACILAETRSGPSYIASAPTPQALDGVGRRLRERNSVRGHREAPVAILAVRYEECENELAALLRAAEISRLSHCWQCG
ncbi:hypothetical protein [Xanthomonas sp. 1678]|uniref:hypothetical protein n=1 Tax=Xanthomonas sp. 1678 TaxID=3158788 RepID=UPI0028679866|nr:hypothetical protein [Xanthomonas translucens]